MISQKKNLEWIDLEESYLDSTFATRFFDEDIPKYDLSDKGMPSDVAYEIIHQQLNLDGNPALNLASFVTTEMEDKADKLIVENLGKNFIDIDEYPETFKIQEYCINILSRMFNSPKYCNSVGCGTIGSSEAIMLALLAHKWSWKKKMKQEGKSCDKPNIVMGADVHAVWEKFALYFDVELKLVPLKRNKYTLTPEDVEANVDENTIAVGCVLGTTFTGDMDPIKEINDKLLEIKDEKGLDIPIHVDAASGGFIIPFTFPGLEWDFRLEQVKSINVSGHKYGLVYPGIGWLIFKDESDIPEELIFDVNYLGGEMSNYSLNFSKGSSGIIAQYYNFLRLGREGYTKIMSNIMKNTISLVNEIEKIDEFELINHTLHFPVIAIKVKDSDFDVYQISALLKSKGWIVPAYTLPADADDIAVLRIVVKENFSRSMINSFISDLKEVLNELKSDSVSKTKRSLLC